MLHTISQIIIPLAVTTSDIPPGLRGDVWELVLHSGPVVKSVIILLLLMSVCCWGITLYKFLVLRSAFKESEVFLNIFWEGTRLSQTYQEAKKLQQSPLAEIFRSGYMELQKFKEVKRSSSPEDNPGIVLSRQLGMGTIRRALDQASIAEQARLEKNLGFLATTGSTAPFIGLFGTVWGIMDSFREIGLRGSANLATVAPGISEALIATAFGLVAAIPAVVAYNYFLGRIRTISSEMDNFSSEFLNIIERHFEVDKRHGNGKQ
jgi:biopolymer transport protein TolQ